MIYLAIFIVLAILSVGEINGLLLKKMQFNIIYWMFVLFLILFSGTRYETGFDYYNYKEVYESVDFTNFIEKTVEIGFASLNILFRSMGFGFNFLIFMIAIVAVGLKSTFIYQNSAYVFLGLLNYFTIGYLINDMGQIRYGLAISISLFAFRDLFFGKFKNAAYKILLATLFHNSVIIIFPIWLIIKFGWLKKNWMIPILICAFPFFFIDIRGFIYSILTYIPINQVRAKLVFYIYSDEYGSQLGFNMSFILRLAIFILLYYFSESGRKRTQNYDILLQLYFYGILLYMVFNSIAEFATRSSAYFKTLDCIVLPFFVAIGKTRFEKNVILIFIVLYAFWSLYKVIYPADLGVAFSSYHSFLLNWLYE